MTDFWQTIPHTMFDFMQFYNDMAATLPNPCNIAEVGVADGASAIFLAERLRDLGKEYRLRMIDNLAYGQVEQLNTIIHNVSESGCAWNIDIMPYDSLNASLKFPDNYFDLVFIDSGHTYELTKAEIRLWIRKVKDGGILAGHDYNSAENPGVKQAIDELIPFQNLHGNLRIISTEKGYDIWKIIKGPFAHIL